MGVGNAGTFQSFFYFFPQVPFVNFFKPFSAPLNISRLQLGNFPINQNVYCNFFARSLVTHLVHHACRVDWGCESSVKVPLEGISRSCSTLLPQLVWVIDQEQMGRDSRISESFVTLPAMTQPLAVRIFRRSLLPSFALITHQRASQEVFMVNLIEFRKPSFPRNPTYKNHRILSQSYTDEDERNELELEDP